MGAGRGFLGARLEGVIVVGVVQSRERVIWEEGGIRVWSRLGGKNVCRCGGAAPDLGTRHQVERCGLS